jgi:hypothetical protein
MAHRTGAEYLGQFLAPIIANGTPLISRTGSLFRKVAGRG